MSPPISQARMSIKRLSRPWRCCLIGLLAFYTVACQVSVPPVAAVTATPTRSAEITPTSPVATPAVVQVSLDSPFELAVGQEIALADTGLHLRFESVLEDSRCPRQVACVWSGQARLAVTIWGGDAAPETKEFSTFSKPPNTSDTHTVQGLSIKLINVDPYPDAPDQPIPAGAYRITLLVTPSQ
jgi:hypothetical protein